MPCTSPMTVGFKHDGKTLTWSQKNFNKELAPFQLPCGKCISCRLEYAREWAVRSVLEASLFEDNSFITLTYDDDHIGDGRLNYRDFQLFAKRLRKAYPNQQIGYMVTGEYGDRRKRAHWHAIIFNWRPRDAQKKYLSDLNCQVYSSEHLTKLWGKGIAEFGDVTFQSASYVARYSLKKLVHGNDQEHGFKPVHKKSSKYAIGKRYIEANWPHVFTRGSVVLPGGSTAPIPRYFKKWLHGTLPEEFFKYYVGVQSKQRQVAAQKQKKEVDQHINDCRFHKKYSISPKERKRKFAEQRLKFLQQNEKDF